MRAFPPSEDLLGYIFIPRNCPEGFAGGCRPWPNHQTILQHFSVFPGATVIPPFIVPTKCITQSSSTNRWQAFQARQFSVAWREALVNCILESYTFCAAHPTPSFIPPPLNPYNRLMAEVLMERDEVLEDAEMEDSEMEDGGGVKHL